VVPVPRAALTPVQSLEILMYGEKPAAESNFSSIKVLLLRTFAKLNCYADKESPNFSDLSFNFVRKCFISHSIRTFRNNEFQRHKINKQ